MGLKRFFGWNYLKDLFGQLFAFLFDLRTTAELDHFANEVKGSLIENFVAFYAVEHFYRLSELLQYKLFYLIRILLVHISVHII